MYIRPLGARKHDDPDTLSWSSSRKVTHCGEPASWSSPTPLERARWPWDNSGDFGEQLWGRTTCYEHHIVGSFKMVGTWFWSLEILESCFRSSSKASMALLAIGLRFSKLQVVKFNHLSMPKGQVDFGLSSKNEKHLKTTTCRKLL